MTVNVAITFDGPSLWTTLHWPKSRAAIVLGPSSYLLRPAAGQGGPPETSPRLSTRSSRQTLLRGTRPRPTEPSHAKLRANSHDRVCECEDHWLGINRNAALPSVVPHLISLFFVMSINLSCNTRRCHVCLCFLVHGDLVTLSRTTDIAWFLYQIRKIITTIRRFDFAVRQEPNTPNTWLIGHTSNSGFEVKLLGNNCRAAAKIKSIMLQANVSVVSSAEFDSSYSKKLDSNSCEVRVSY
jgi:hypothetical protein